jgi:hypothetical protein
VTEAEFWSFVDRRSADACWHWTGRKTTRGYGQIQGEGSWTGAHRRAYSLTKGEIPDGHYVCHTCDNPPCCNPAHLFIGTPQDNVDDMIAKGRARLVGRPRENPTHCPNGHPLDEANTGQWGPHGYRKCRPCNRAASQRYRERRKASVS